MDEQNGVLGYTFQSWTYELWGNDYEGYTVNDRYKGEQIFIPAYILNDTNEVLIQYLQGINFLVHDIDLDKVEITGETDFTMYFSYDGKPDFELENLSQ